MTENSKLDVIRKLLAKAERAGTPEEAESYAAKAEELMVRYSIDAVEVAAERQEGFGAIGTRRITLDGYPLPKSHLLAAIARPLNCDVLIQSVSGYRGVKVAIVYGHERDLEAFDVLATSLLLQAVTGATQAHKRTPWVNGRTFRHNFLLGFAGRVHERMQAAREEVVETVSTSTAVALVDRAAAVRNHIRSQHDRLGKSRSSITDRGSYLAGDEAGRRARLTTDTEVGSRSQPMLHN